MQALRPADGSGPPLAPRRACLGSLGRRRSLPDLWLYIGRGSSKHGLGQSLWANPFAIGRDGGRREVISRFRDYLSENTSLQGQLVAELSGKHLACHCAAHEPCHADVLIEYFHMLSGGAPEDDGPTSDEDELGLPKARAGAGWVGSGPPLLAAYGSRRRDVVDGGGLCSPGRWSVHQRRRPELAPRIAEVIDDVITQMANVEGSEFIDRVGSSLACGACTADPLGQWVGKARDALELLASGLGFARTHRPVHQACVLDLELLQFLVTQLGDPDAGFVERLFQGVPLGWRERLPRTPAVFERKSRWTKHVGTYDFGREVAANYRSADAQLRNIEETFAEQEAAGMMIRTTYAEARRRFGDRLRIAALGAVPQDDGFRVIHDGTHHVGVNTCIRVRDQEAVPTHDDIKAVLDEEFRVSGDGLFAFAFDISKAPRRVGVCERDWGLQACSTCPADHELLDSDPVWLNTVGTYGVGSASYWWGRLGALLQRLVLYVVSGRSLRWVMRFADDFLSLLRAPGVFRNIIAMLLLLRALGVPIKWAKCRGGFGVPWVGYFLCLERKLLGVSESRCAWIRRWCLRTVTDGKVHTQEFRECLGRLSFATGVLPFVRPFLGPLYTWIALQAECTIVELPPLVIFVLQWIEARFGPEYWTPVGADLHHAGELFRTDAKAEGDRIVIGGWEVLGAKPTHEARWFSLELTKDDIPWAYTRGDPFRSVASLELLATLVAVLVFGPAPGSLRKGLLSITGSGDNQSNGFTLDKLCSTKYPLYLALMELAEQLHSAGLLLSVAWRPRDENEEADALTNGIFTAFTPALRVNVKWADLPFKVLPKLAASAEALFKERQSAKAAAKEPARTAGGGKRRKPLREKDPW